MEEKERKKKRSVWGEVVESELPILSWGSLFFLCPSPQLGASRQDVSPSLGAASQQSVSVL